MRRPSPPPRHYGDCVSVSQPVNTCYWPLDNPKCSQLWRLPGWLADRSLIRAEYSHNICLTRVHLSAECHIYWSLTVSHMLARTALWHGAMRWCGAVVPGVMALWLQDNHRDHHCLSQSTRRENINTNLDNLQPSPEMLVWWGGCSFILINRKVWCNWDFQFWAPDWTGLDCDQLRDQR